MTIDNTDRLVKWQPELSERAVAHLDELRRTVAPRVSLVRQVRSALGYSQVDMADLLGLTQSAVSKMEMKGDPPLSTLSKIAADKRMKMKVVMESEDGEHFEFGVPV